MIKLLIVDGDNIAHRAFHTSKFSFFSMLDKAIKRTEPERVAFAFGNGEKGWRHKQYPAYKANRKPPPIGLKRWLSDLVHALFSAGLGVYEDTEADDVINTILSRFLYEADSPLSRHAWILSSDKDMYSLVDHDCSVLTFKRCGESHYQQQAVGKQEVRDELGVWPFQVSYYKALVGGHDNVPGCPLIGKKSAQILLGEFTSISNIYDNIDDIDCISLRKKKEIKQSLLDNRQQVELSAELSEITFSRLRIDFDRCVVPDAITLSQVVTNLKKRWP